MATDNLKTASVLAFERKLDPSDALFSAGDWNDLGNSAQWKPVSIREKSVRGTISNRLKAAQQDPLKLDAAIENPNLQTVDVATLPANADTLKVSFTLRVLGGAGRPRPATTPTTSRNCTTTVKGYVMRTALACWPDAMPANLANGRFLWRNRLGAEAV